MSNSFKFTNKKRKGHNSITLDRKHKEMTKKFADDHSSLPNKKIFLINLQKQYEVMCKNYKNASHLSDNNIDDKFKLTKHIKELKKEIDVIETDENRSEYYLSTLGLLSKYYNKDSAKENKKGKLEQRSIDFFYKNKKNSVKITKYISQTNTFNRSDILDEYLSKIDKNYSGKYEYSTNESYCNKCNQEKTLINSEASYVCQKCGNASFIIIDSERPSYKEPPSEISYFAYKRINIVRSMRTLNLIIIFYIMMIVLKRHWGGNAPIFWITMN